MIESSFWSNKGAVGGVSTIVGLVATVIISFLLFTYMRRTKKNGSRRYKEELFNSCFDRQQLRYGSSLVLITYPELDPFAAAEGGPGPREWCVASSRDLRKFISG